MCNLCAYHCQLCGEAEPEDCRDCRGDEMSEEQKFWLVAGTLALGLMYLEFASARSGD